MLMYFSNEKVIRKDLSGFKNPSLDITKKLHGVSIQYQDLQPWYQSQQVMRDFYNNLIE